MKERSDILSTLYEESFIFVLALLNLSAAFDTIDYAFLLSRLRGMYEVHDQELVWTRSYLSSLSF